MLRRFAVLPRGIKIAQNGYWKIPVMHASSSSSTVLKPITYAVDSSDAKNNKKKIEIIPTAYQKLIADGELQKSIDFILQTANENAPMNASWMKLLFSLFDGSKPSLYAIHSAYHRYLQDNESHIDLQYTLLKMNVKCRLYKQAICVYEDLISNPKSFKVKNFKYGYKIAWEARDRLFAHKVRRDQEKIGFENEFLTVKYLRLLYYIGGLRSFEETVDLWKIDRIPEGALYSTLAQLSQDGSTTKEHLWKYWLLVQKKENIHDHVIYRMWQYYEQVGEVERADIMEQELSSRGIFVYPLTLMDF